MGNPANSAPGLRTARRPREAVLHFVAPQPQLEDFAPPHGPAMNASNAQLRNPSDHQTRDNGINEFYFVTSAAIPAVLLAPTVVSPSSPAARASLPDRGRAGSARPRTPRSTVSCAIAASCAVGRSRIRPTFPRLPKFSRCVIAGADCNGSLRSERDTPAPNLIQSLADTARSGRGPSRLAAMAPKTPGSARHGAACPPTPKPPLTNSPSRRPAPAARFAA